MVLVIKQKRIYREDIKNNPNLLYVFGDNLDREGLGGQAFEMRGEPNSFGIATKRSISHSYPDDYFFDEQEDVIEIIATEFGRLECALCIVDTGVDGLSEPRLKYDGVVIPSDGLGTGLSKLPEYAPKALQYIEQRIKDLEYL